MKYLFIALFFCSSCNFLKLVDRKQEQRFYKEEIPLYKIRNAGVVHAVHYANKQRQKVMLVHGYGASGISQYYRSALLLNEQYDVILPDLLYCGKSVGDGKDFSIDAQVGHLKLILDTLEIREPVVLIGNSYGGIVSAYFAEKYPSYVSKLVIYDAPVSNYTSAYADSLARTLEVPSLKELVAPTTIRENKVSLDLIFYDQPFIPRFLRRQMLKYGTIPARPVQLKLLDELIEKEAEMNAHKFTWTMPVYVCWGEFDQLIPMSTCMGIMRRYALPADHLHIFPKAAHAANVEYPEEFADYVKSIITR